MFRVKRELAIPGELELLRIAREHNPAVQSSELEFDIYHESIWPARMELAGRHGFCRLAAFTYHFDDACEAFAFFVARAAQKAEHSDHRDDYILAMRVPLAEKLEGTHWPKTVAIDCRTGKPCVWDRNGESVNQRLRRERQEREAATESGVAA